MLRGQPDGGSRLGKPHGASRRKVRSPQGSMPANGRGVGRQGPIYGKCHRKYTAGSVKGIGKGEKVR